MVTEQEIKATAEADTVQWIADHRERTKQRRMAVLVSEWLEKSKGCSYAGVALHEMTRDELSSALGCMIHSQYQRENLHRG